MFDVAHFARELAAGQTVVVLGRLPEAAPALLVTVLGPTGLLVTVDAAGVRVNAGATLRALPHATGILSHAVDVVLVSGAGPPDWELAAEECRRILAPRGRLAAALPVAEAAVLAAALGAVRFRSVEEQPADGVTLLRARGP